MRTLPALPHLLASLALCAGLAGCPGAGPAGGAETNGGSPARAAAPSANAAPTEAATLGRELFGIMDRVMAYKSDHFAQLPRDLPSMGVDSLTRTTVRRLTVSNGVPMLVVAYRHPEGHAITQCSGSNAVIEDSMLNGGAYTVLCLLNGGPSQSFTVGG